MMQELRMKESDSGGGRSKMSHRKVSYGFHSAEGRMGHPMEDYMVARFQEVDGHELGLFAVFDGHSGGGVAHYLRQHLFNNILNEPDFWTDTETAVRRACASTDKEVLEKEEEDSGSTAVTAILIDGRRLVVANVGDSRAVMCAAGKARVLTVDHDPERERRAVESRGGFVTSAIGNVPRVDAQLGVGRAFGDRSLKEHISSTPDIVMGTLDTDAEFLILASDGLWKIMTNQEAVDVIMDLLDPKEAAKQLVKEGLARKSADDISCVVVRLG